MYETDRIKLKQLCPYEHSDYFRWFNDPEVTKYTSHGAYPMDKKTCENYIIESNKSKDILLFGIFYEWEYGETHIGNVSLQQINYITRVAELAIIIGEKDFYHSGIGTEACKLMVDHGFSKMGLNKIWLGTSSVNEGMRKVAINCNMRVECTLQDESFVEGNIHSVIRYYILKEVWKVVKDEQGI